MLQFTHVGEKQILQALDFIRVSVTAAIFKDSRFERERFTRESRGRCEWPIVPVDLAGFDSGLGVGHYETYQYGGAAVMVTHTKSIDALVAHILEPNANERIATCGTD